MLTLGIDPDTSNTSFAWWDHKGPVSAIVAHVVRGRKDKHVLMGTAAAISHARPLLSGVEVVAVESQQIDSRTITAKSLIHLAQVTGICIAFVAERYPNANLLVPTPSEWKKGVAKHAHQGRLYQELGWGYEIIGSGKSRYARPLRAPQAFSHITRGQWRHVGDALLLAKWAQNQ